MEKGGRYSLCNEDRQLDGPTADHLPRERTDGAGDDGVSPSRLIPWAARMEDVQTHTKYGSKYMGGHRGQVGARAGFRDWCY